MNDHKQPRRPKGWYSNPNGKWRKEFLAVIAECGNVTEACRRLSLTWTEVYKTKLEDPEFKAQWEAAVEASLDKLEAEVGRRAHVCSDKLAAWILSRRRPEKWGDHSKDAPTGAQQVIINVTEREKEDMDGRRA